MFRPAPESGAVPGGGGDGDAWLAGQAAAGMACDATVTPIVTGDIDPAVIGEWVPSLLCLSLCLLSLCLEFLLEFGFG
jgi:hypothetical protein